MEGTSTGILRPATNFPDPVGYGAPALPPPAPAPAPEPIANELARRIAGIVSANPGIHFRGVSRAAQLNSAGQLRHHLERLKRAGHIREVGDGRYKRFFPSQGYDEDLTPTVARFSRPLPRSIGRLLLSRPMNRTELRRRLGCADSTLGYHLNRMLVLGDVERQRTRNGSQYAVCDPDLVRRAVQPEAASHVPAGRPPAPAAAPPAAVPPEPGASAGNPLAAPAAPPAGPLAPGTEYQA